MYITKYTKNPGRTLWIGWTEYNNGVYFNSGRTLDELMKHTKAMLYKAQGVSGRQIYLDKKPSDISMVPVEKMSNIFCGKYWKKGWNGISLFNVPTFDRPAQPQPEKKVEPADKYDCYEYEVRDGKLILFGVIRREVGQFDLSKNKTEGRENVEY